MNNGFWNGTQMALGDSWDGSDDAIGHEFTHGVTANEANLYYYMQSGAINESFSDIWGELIDLSYTNGNDDDTPGARWLMGEDLSGGAIRSMSDPTLYNDPDAMTSGIFYCGLGDNGGVHINSGIPNHAFYITALEIGGFAWEKTGLIWYKALTNKLKTGSNFQDAAKLTFATAGELFGPGSLEQNAVKKGWAEVGLAINTGTPPPDQNPLRALRARPGDTLRRTAIRLRMAVRGGQLTGSSVRVPAGTP